MENLPSTSSSTRSSHNVYDVFINHRGPDVKIALAQPLYRRLRHDLNLQVFLDKEELQMGDSFPSLIAHAIKNAKVHIAIFSKGYAESAWCLDELCLMLHGGAPILPVFYDVKASDLRYIESGLYAESFKAHKRKKRYGPQILQKWKEALKDVSYRTGLEFGSTSNEGHETLLQRIVSSVSKNVKMGLEVAVHPVGLDEEIENFEIAMAEYDNRGKNMVKVVGIVGMGGSGKTTLAKELHNRKSLEYGNKSCFLFDVRESSATKGLGFLQSMLLKELGLSTDTIYSSNQGKEVLRRQLRGKRVLITLDDIDSADQLEALLVTDVLGPDSLVLITSRYKDVLIQCGISILYDKRGMDRKDATYLFCWHAFLRRDPMDGFEHLVEKFLNVCNGLPLSLKVIGRQLRGRIEKSYWDGQLQKICAILPADITKILKVSYDALDEEQKEIFLDIACFFTGENKGKAVSIWEASGWNGLHALHVLEDRCLIDFDENDLRMHDHLRDMGRDIAKFSQSPRLRRADRSNFLHMIKQPSEDALLEEVGSRILHFQHESNVLQLLAVDSNGPARKFVKLLWLRWQNCPCRSIPSFLSIGELRVLEINGSSNLEKLWDEPTSQAPLHLRELYMRSCMTLQKIANSITSLANLRKLVLSMDCGATPELGMELPDEFCCLKSLEHLELDGYSKLNSLPGRFGDLTNLRHLNLSSCSNLEALPGSFNQLMQLQHLSFSRCSRLILPQDMCGNISTLKHVDFIGCGNLEVLPIAITQQRYLKTLRASCTQLPDEIGELRNLEVLEVDGEFMTLLPSSVGNLCRLKKLKLNCPKLSSLPESIGLLEHLEMLNIIDSGVQRLPEGVAHLNNLQQLCIYRSPICKVMFRKSGLSDGSCMFGLKRIVLSSTETTFISIAEDVCPNLLSLVVNHCRKLKDVKLVLPTTLIRLTIRHCQVLKRITGLSDLAKLRSLKISECVEMERLQSLAHLTSLNKLVISGCRKLKNIKGVGHLSSLKVLDADSCWNLQRIEGLDRLQGLNRWQISSEKWTHIEGLQRLCAGSSNSVVTMSEAAGNADNSGMFVESVLNSLKSPFAASVKSFSLAERGWELKLSEMDVNTCSTIVTCIAFKSSARASLSPYISSSKALYETKVKVGRWISLGVFAKNSEIVRKLKAESDDGTCLLIDRGTELEIKEAWAMLVGDTVEEEENILEIWRKLLHRVYSPRYTLLP